jgi:hypothetical protein
MVTPVGIGVKIKSALSLTQYKTAVTENHLSVVCPTAKVNIA